MIQKMHFNSVKFMAAALCFVFVGSSLSWAATPEQGYELLRLHIKSQSNLNFSQTLNSLEPAKKASLEKLISSFYFIDYEHAAPDLMDAYSGSQKLTDLKTPYLYDFEDQKAFDSFTRARESLSQMGSRLTLEGIQKLHRLTLPWIVHQGIEPGQIRPWEMYGLDFNNGLSPEQLQILSRNPYLSFKPGTGIQNGQLLGTSEAKNGDNLRGIIIYPRPKDVRPEILFTLEKSHPDLIQKILDFQARERDMSSAEFFRLNGELTTLLVTALLEDKIQSFEAEQEKIGPLNSRYRIEQYIRLIARFQKDFISIHPFIDGNGRTSRLILSYLAERRGLPSPRLLSPNDDLLSRGQDWEKQIYDGMIATILLKKDLKRRIQNHLPLEKSVALLNPSLSKLQLEDLSAYEKFLEGRLDQDPALREAWKQNPFSSMIQIEKEFKSQSRSCSKVHRAG